MTRRSAIQRSLGIPESHHRFSPSPAHGGYHRSMLDALRRRFLRPSSYLVARSDRPWSISDGAYRTDLKPDEKVPGARPPGESCAQFTSEEAAVREAYERANSAAWPGTWHVV